MKEININEININEIKEELSKNSDLYGYILEIFDGDYGCEERLEGKSLMVSVKLLTRDGEVYVRVEDEKLTENGLDEDMYVKKGLI